MIKISAYIVTLNEEERLEKTLKALESVADEIIIVDSGSTDKTEKIARQHGAKFIFRTWISYCDQKHFAEKKCSNDWVLLVDADEVLNDELIADIQKIKQKPLFNAYNIKIKNILPHQAKPYLPWANFNTVRLYNRTVCSMPKDKGNLDRVYTPSSERVGQLKGYMKHYSFLSIEQTIAKYNAHSSEMQKELDKKGKKYSFFRLIIEYPRQFFKYYLFHGLILGGSQGFIYAQLLTFFRFSKIAKNFENRMLLSARSNKHQAKN